jgi:hypothetical protein
MKNIARKEILKVKGLVNLSLEFSLFILELFTMLEKLVCLKADLNLHKMERYI